MLANVGCQGPASPHVHGDMDHEVVVLTWCSSSSANEARGKEDTRLRGMAFRRVFDDRGPSLESPDHRGLRNGRRGASFMLNSLAMKDVHAP